MKYNSTTFRLIAKTLFCVLVIQLVFPAMQSYALTSGPTQPEVQSFEPVGTTDMVDLFSGDFVYNIPLLDVEGYPINISYHSGSGVEDEASWVGLGWNINPGVINRSVRGIPDDYSGEKIVKTLKMKDEIERTLGTGASIELFGYSALRMGIGTSLTYNNYKGLGVGFNANLSFAPKYFSTGLGVSVSSFDGADVTANASLKYSTSPTNGEDKATSAVSVSTGFNTRAGLRAISYGFSRTYSKDTKDKSSPKHNLPPGLSFSSYIPIGMKNYVSSITNASHARGLSFDLGAGVETWGGYPHFRVSFSGTELRHEMDGTKNAFGYLHLEKSSEHDLLDFSRDKDGVYNNTLPNLPLSSMTYDIYSVSGQGTGGMFRPFRNDLGTVFDPKIGSDDRSLNLNFEAGIGGLFELGVNTDIYMSNMNAGPWMRRGFLKKSKGSLFENFYFKQAGEMTHSKLAQQNNPILDKNPITVDTGFNVFGKNKQGIGTLPRYLGAHEDRAPRANNISFFTNLEASKPDVAIRQKIENYMANKFTHNNTQITKIDRVNTTDNGLDLVKGSQIGEITQILPDGRRYIFSIPAKNNIQKEVTFSVESPQYGHASYNSGLINYEGVDDGIGNKKGRDQFYQSTLTPAYAHSFLLTDVLSTDYVDITGDGPSEDDLGSYTKLNYTLADNDFRWRTPYSGNPGSNAIVNVAQFMPGYYADKGDDKGSYILGSKELWYMHSIESKNYIAEFYTSPRTDGLGVKDPVVGNNVQVKNNALKATKASPSVLYKLDSIKLFNKNDRFANGNNAVAIKTVIFVYENDVTKQLCPNIPNSSVGGGKLTLKRIFFKSGTSSRSLMNPYEFEYSAYNPPYAFSCKDRWGNFKNNQQGLSSFEFPYVEQNKQRADSNATAYQLTKINMPSGGAININYEADDYSFVQDKAAMEMYKVIGVGNAPSFSPTNILYEGEDAINNYVYFKRDLSREIAGKTLRENYLPNDDLAYFNFFTDLTASNLYEPIKGYAKVEEVAICPNNSQYGYFKLAKERAGKNTDKMLHPVSLCAFNLGRSSLPHLIYPGATHDGSISIQQTIAGLKAAADELFTIAKNPNLRFVSRGLAKKIDVSRSWIRTNSPGYTKMGGGSRVKTLTFTDGWDEMTPNGTVSVVGKEYNYTIKDPNSNKLISSGVANYEPLVGGDENPLRKPVPYIGDGGRLLPAIQAYQEEPLGESFYPSGSVGYSKVTVTSINKNISRSGKGVDEYEFYTAKDFPYYIEKTVINTEEKYKLNNLVQRNSILGLSQGYSLVLNDMHGKAKSVSNSVLKGNDKELISSVKYNYQIDNQGKLDNTVKMVTRGVNPFNPSFTVQNGTLGQEVDCTIDSRERVNKSLNIPINFNLNVLQIGVFPFPVPSVFSPVKLEKDVFKTVTVTKVTQQYGILKSTEVIDHGAKKINENMVYDAETGQVIVSKSNNEYNDPVTNVSFPSNWAYLNMGGAYANLGFESSADSLYVDSLLDGHITGLHTQNVFTEGDELLVTDKNNNSYRLWVEGYSSGCPMATNAYPTAPPPNYIDSNYNYNATPPRCCKLKVSYRGKYPAGNSTPWKAPKTLIKDISIKILRSGRKNQLANFIQNVSLAGTFNPSTFADFYNNNLYQGKVITASATKYTNKAEEDNIDIATWGSNYIFNPFIRGLKGAYKPFEEYAYLENRDYSSEHSRKNGVLTSFSSIWAYPNGVSLSYCQELAQKHNNLWYNTLANWKRLKQISKYSPSGLPIEEVDASGIYSTALMSYDNSLPIAVANNAKYRQIKYSSFDDIFGLYNQNSINLNKFAAMAPINNLNTAYNLYNRMFGKFQPADIDAGVTVVDIAHTGKYALQFTANSGKFYIGHGSNYGIGNKYYISMWIKGAPTNYNVQIVELPGQYLQGVPISMVHQPFTIFSNPIEGWVKVEGYFNIPSNRGYYLRLPSGFIVDDIRICPEKSNMKTFVYDPLTYKLAAQLDENNYATFFEYDQEGKLVRTKKETHKGIVTLSESRMSTAK